LPSPLGNFEPNAPINPAIVSRAQAVLADLPDAPGINRGYLHWTVAPPYVSFPDYNGSVVQHEGSFALSVTHDPRDNAAGLTPNAPASHTWQRNTNAVGFAIGGMDGASQQDFGPNPVTVAGLEWLCAGMAAFAAKYKLDAMGSVPPPGTTHKSDAAGTVNTTGEPVIITHAEAALFDAYFCGYTDDPDCRWDLGSFVAQPDGVTPTMAHQCGEALRLRIHTYKIALEAA
jgi:hypothetical protein